MILPGLALLGTEYVWAQRLLRIAKEKATQAKDMLLRKKEEDDPEPGGEQQA
ncbi:MAG: PGPGW domain-containing protein [Actinomycetota bacterium]